MMLVRWTYIGNLSPFGGAGDCVSAGRRGAAPRAGTRPRQRHGACAARRHPAPVRARLGQCEPQLSARAGARAPAGLRAFGLRLPSDHPRRVRRFRTRAAACPPARPAIHQTRATTCSTCASRRAGWRTRKPKSSRCRTSRPRPCRSSPCAARSPCCARMQAARFATTNTPAGSFPITPAVSSHWHALVTIAASTAAAKIVNHMVVPLSVRLAA